MTNSRTPAMRRAKARSAAAPEAADALFVRSIGKAMEVLSAWRDGARDKSLADLAAATGLDKSSAQRIAHTLSKLGWLEKDAATKRLRLAPRVLDLAYDYLRQDPLVAAATPVLVQLRRETGERVSLSLFDDTTLIYAVRLEARSDSLRTSLVGRRVPVFCTAGGRAILSCLPEAEARRILQRSDRTAATPHTQTDPAKIMTLVRKAKQQGYALASGELRFREITIGVAIRGADGAPVAALHIAGSTEDWTPEEFERRFAARAMEAAQSLTRDLPLG